MSQDTPNQEGDEAATTALHKSWALAATGALSMFILAMDTAFPLGFAGGVPYIVPVLLGFWSPYRHHAVVFALIGTALTITGFYLSLPAGDPGIVIANRGLAIFAVWTTAVGVTLQQRTQERLRASERALAERRELVKMGEVAAAIAHEIRNPLAGIAATLQVIEGRLEEGSRELRVVGDVRIRIRGLNDTLTELLDFARPKTPTRRPIDLGRWVRLVLEEASKDSLFDEIDLRRDLGQATVSADPEQLRGVLLNLLLNAGQAVDGRGVVQVGQRAVGTTCLLSIDDDGPGLDPELRERVFEPFFTLRTRGSGLGLPLAQRSIRAHGGRIWFEDGHLGGARVVVELPFE